jgi:hypothetical protein
MKKWEVAVFPRGALHEGEAEDTASEEGCAGHEYDCVYATFEKLGPWRMGLVALQSSHEAGILTAYQKSRRK